MNIVYTAQPDLNRRQLFHRRVQTRLARRSLGPRMRVFAAVNQRSKRSVLGDADVTVSLTTHGTRTDNAFYAIESIAAGRVRPKQLILWLDEGSPDTLPRTLRNLQHRGLTIRWSENYGPHTKYFPYVNSLPEHTRPLVTADDDTFYPRTWLSTLLRTVDKRHANDPHIREVTCYRARRITWNGDALAPYNNWPVTIGTHASILNLATGVSGVHYPAHLLNQLHAAGDAFRGRCERADDIWLHAIALRAGYRARPIRTVPRHFVSIHAEDDIKLWATNVQQGANDTAIANTYTDTDLNTLRAERRRMGGD